MSRLTSYEKRMLRQRERAERQLSFNQGSRIMDRRDPVETDPDDERLDDCTFVGQGCVSEPFEPCDGPDIEDDLDVGDDTGYGADDSPADRYQEMAERLGVNDAAQPVVTVQTVIDQRAIEVRPREEEQLLRHMLIGDDRECTPRKDVSSWKQTTTQPAQYLRHARRGASA